MLPLQRGISASTAQSRPSSPKIAETRSFRREKWQQSLHGLTCGVIITSDPESPMTLHIGLVTAQDLREERWVGSWLIVATGKMALGLASWLSQSSTTSTPSVESGHLFRPSDGIIVIHMQPSICCDEAASRRAGLAAWPLPLASSAMHATDDCTLVSSDRNTHWTLKCALTEFLSCR